MNGYTFNLSDRKTLIQRCIDKDHTAWAHFVGLYEGLIRWSVCRKLDMMNFHVSRSEVADIVQEIFMAIWKKEKLSSLGNTVSLKRWLVVVSKNATSNYYRKRINNREVELSKPFENDLLPDANEDISHSGSLCPNYEESIELNEAKVILKQEIRRLNRKQRLALKLSIYDYKKQKDIAGIMGISLNTAASLISRAKTQVSKAMKECYAY